MPQFPSENALQGCSGFALVYDKSKDKDFGLQNYQLLHNFN